MKRFLLALFLVLGLSVLCVASCSAVTKISVAANLWPPFTDPEDPKGGIAIEIVRAAFTSQGYEIEVEFMPWARVEEMVKDGAYDITSSWMTEKQKDYLLFSEPYIWNDIKLIKRTGDPFEYNGFESLKGLTIGVVRGYGYDDTFDNSTEFTREDAVDLTTNVRKLVAGRIDLTLEDEIATRAELSKVAPELLDKIEFSATPLISQTLHVVSGLKNPKHKEIVEIFQKGLAQIKEDGTFDKIFASYGLK